MRPSNGLVKSLLQVRKRTPPPYIPSFLKSYSSPTTMVVQIGGPHPWHSDQIVPNGLFCPGPECIHLPDLQNKEKIGDLAIKRVNV